LTSVGEENSKHDVAKANALLDDLGMKTKDADGFRMGPDGKPFSILLEHAADAPDFQPAAELVAAQLKEVGIKINVKRLESALRDQRRNANELQATVGWTHDQGWGNGYTGGAADSAGRQWELWHSSNGKQGEEPPAWVKQAYDLDVKRWSAVAGSDEYNKLMEEGFAWSRTNLPIIQIVEKVKYPMIAKKTLRNVPQGGFAIAANFAGEQLWYGK